MDRSLPRCYEGDLLSPTEICFPQHVVGVFVHLGQWNLTHGSGGAITRVQRGRRFIVITVGGEETGQEGSERGGRLEQFSTPHSPPLTAHSTHRHTLSYNAHMLAHRQHVQCTLTFRSPFAHSFVASICVPERLPPSRALGLVFGPAAVQGLLRQPSCGEPF